MAKYDGRLRGGWGVCVEGRWWGGGVVAVRVGGGGRKAREPRATHIKRTLCFMTQHANFRGNSFFQATKQLDLST